MSERTSNRRDALDAAGRTGGADPGTSWGAEWRAFSATLANYAVCTPVPTGRRRRSQQGPFRPDIFADLFPGHIEPEEAAVSAPGLGLNPWHYIVVDVKFTTLHLLLDDWQPEEKQCGP